MTILYKPVKIESVEEAEALPGGTVALQSWGHGTTARTLTNGRWITPSGSALPHAEVVGMQALVSIEAEEEHRPAHWMDAYYPNAPKRMQTRFTTPWEGA